jgi:hypothetical protein
MIPYGFTRLDGLRGLIDLRWLFDLRLLFSGLLVDLLSGYCRSYKQTGIVGSERQLHTCAKSAITRGRFIVAFGIGEGVLLPGQEG